MASTLHFPGVRSMLVHKASTLLLGFFGLVIQVAALCGGVGWVPPKDHLCKRVTTQQGGSTPRATSTTPEPKVRFQKKEPAGPEAAVEDPPARLLLASSPVHR